MPFVLPFSSPLLVSVRFERHKIFDVLLFFFFYLPAAREALPTWDKQIQSLCFQVNNLLEKIRSAAPEWAAQAMETQMTQ